MPVGLGRLCFGYFILIALAILGSCVTDDLVPPVDCELEGPVIAGTQVGDADCNQQNGFVEATASNGTGDFQYRINAGPLQGEPRFPNLGSGTYMVTVMDANGCMATVSVNIKNKEGVNLILSSEESGCSGSSGSILATPEGGEQPYVYSLNGGPFQDSQEFSNLVQGEYRVTIRDQTDCESSQSIRVNSGISFAVDIAPIIESSCAIDDCHNGHQFPDFRQFKNIRDNAGMVKALTANKTMPQKGSLTQSQIDEIACWVNDGARAN